MKECVDKMKGKIKFMTWNVQKASINFPRGCRFVEILRCVQKTSIKIAFFSESTSREQGILWIKSQKFLGWSFMEEKQQYFLGMIGLKSGKSKGAKNGFQIGLQL